MKIYEIGTGYTPIPAQMGAATEIVVEELVKSFRKQGVDVDLIDIHAKERAANNLQITEIMIPKCFSDTDVKLGVMHKLKRVAYSVALAGKLKKILKAAKEPMILHFHNQYNLFFFLKLVSPKLRAKSKIAYTVHSYIWPGEWEEIKDTIQKRYFQEVYCVQNADYVLVLNDKTAEHFAQHLGVNTERIYKIGNGVNTDTYHILEGDETERIKDKLGLSGQKIIFQVGSVCDRKNQLGAVMMLKTYLKEHRDVTYVYAGGVISPEYQEKISCFATENDIEKQVKYVGELCPGRELNQYYNAAAVTVFPSKIESFGLVIIESLASGTPVILADKPLFALDHGYHVYNSETEFVQLVDGYIQNCGNYSVERGEVLEKYSWDRIALDHLNIWTLGNS